MTLPKKVRQEKQEILEACRKAPGVLKKLRSITDVDVPERIFTWIAEGMARDKERAWEIDLME